MLTLLLGADDFSKKEYISSLAEKEKAGVEFFVDRENAPGLGRLLAQDLFAGKKIQVLESLLNCFDLNEEALGRLLKSQNRIIFIEEKLDKRISQNKKLLANKAVEAKDFSLPHNKDLDKWIISHIKAGGGAITDKAADLLAKKLGRDQAQEIRAGGKVVEVREIYNLWQAGSEVKKLLALARGREITESDVESLVPEIIEVDVLGVVNAIADKKKNLALGLIRGFLESGGGDGKTKVIQLNALLAEQFRNVLMVQDFILRGVSESEILDTTGWKSGRLFVLKKIAGRFVSSIVRDFLGKLEHLDGELKTSQTPPKVLLDLIVAQLF